MSPEEKQKLRELWDFIEKVENNTMAYDLHKHSGPSLPDISEKFEELFTKELND